MSWLVLGVEYITAKIELGLIVTYNIAARVFEDKLGPITVRTTVYALSVQNAFDYNIMALATTMGLSVETRNQLFQRDPMWLRRHRLRFVATVASLLALIPLILALVLPLRNRPDYISRFFKPGGWLWTTIFSMFTPLIWTVYHMAYMVRHKRPQIQVVQFVVDGVLAFWLLFVGIAFNTARVYHRYKYNHNAAAVAPPFIFTAIAMQLALFIWWCVEISDQRNADIVRRVIREMKDEGELARVEVSGNTAPYRDERNV